MTSTIKADVVTAQTTNGNVTLQGNGTGTVAISDNTAITGTLSATGAATLSSQAYPTAGGLWSGRNMVINGSMAVSQRATSATGLGAAASYPTLDRYQLAGNTNGRVTMSQTADGPSGIANCLKLACTTADTSIASGGYFFFHQKFEGQNLQRWAKGTADAKTVTVSFWVKGNASATYVVALEDADNTRHCGFTFPVTTSWTRITRTFPADTTGAFDDDNAYSLTCIFHLSAGSDRTSGTLPSTWQATVTANRCPGITQFLDSTSRTFFLTGLQMEVGAATPFEHESYSETLQKCQRYFTKIAPKVNAVTVRGYNSSGAVVSSWFSFPTQMRTEPTCAITGTWAVSNCGQPAFQSFSVDGFLFGATTSSAADTYFYPDASSEYITASAEL